ncbi:MAG: DUF4345 domain-containing protein [Parvularculaceae bacterium]
MKLGLQIILALLSLIPLGFGALGVLGGAARFVPLDAAIAPLDSQFRFLSALYVGVGVLIWRIIPSVEKHGWIMSTLIAAIFAGGLARLYSAALTGETPPLMIAATGLELASPALILWQRAVARRSRA